MDRGTDAHPSLRQGILWVPSGSGAVRAGETPRRAVSLGPREGVEEAVGIVLSFDDVCADCGLWRICFRLNRTLGQGR